MEGSGLMGAGIGAGSSAGGDNMIQRLQKAMDLEETDRDTLHLLTFLFMQFLSQSNIVSSFIRDKYKYAKFLFTILSYILLY